MSDRTALASTINRASDRTALLVHSTKTLNVPTASTQPKEENPLELPAPLRSAGSSLPHPFASLRGLVLDIAGYFP